MVLIEYRTYIPRGYGLIGFIIISFLYEELAARARENHATTEYLHARYFIVRLSFLEIPVARYLSIAYGHIDCRIVMLLDNITSSAGRAGLRPACHSSS